VPASDIDNARLEQGIPTFSVVIASHRPPLQIRSCLEALAAQDYPMDKFEVVVVDDGSPVPLAPVIAEFAQSLRARVHRQTNAGPAAARNTGARLATGDLLAFTDDDCVPATDWLRRLSDALAGDPEALVGGLVVNRLSHDRFADATQCLITFLYDSYGNESARRFFTSNNMALSRARFAAAGGFDDAFRVPGGEDREFCERWQSQGRPLVHAPRAVVSHAHGMTLASFVRQHRNYGRGAYQLRRRGHEEHGAGKRLESLRFYARLVVNPFGRLPVGRALAQSVLLVVSQAATAAGYAQEWRLSRR
jgi:GT2 family glycosyltransferase